MVEEVLRHIALRPDQVLPVVMVVGDPARVDNVKELCDSFVELAHRREYKSVECTYKNQKFLCVSHGVGSSGATVCFDELIQNGAKVIIRAGSCGSLQPGSIKQGDLCISKAAVREDRVSHLLVPADFPAVADFEVYGELLKSSIASNIKTHAGVIGISSDLYYAHDVVKSSLELYSKANVSIVDMESASLFVLGTLQNVKTGGIYIVDGCPFHWKEGDINVNLNPEQLNKMLTVVLDACSSLAAKYNK